MPDTLAPDEEGPHQDPSMALYAPDDPEGPDYAERTTFTTFALGVLTVEGFGRPLR